ncbi:hypothetical protein PG984_001955 [Apiospora sp. TS-2023a]
MTAPIRRVGLNPRHGEAQPDLVTYFSHGDQQGFKHVKDLFQLIRAEPDIFSPAARAHYVASINGLTTSQFHAVQQHRERNLHDLVQISESYPAGHANIVIALQRFRDAQRQLSRLEEQLADQLNECALHSRMHGSMRESPTNGRIIHDLLDDFSSSCTFRQQAPDLILFGHEPTKNQQSAQPTPVGAYASRTSPKKPALIIPAACAASPASRTPNGGIPLTSTTEAPSRSQPEVLIPNEDLLDRLYDTERMRNQAIRTYAKQNGTIPPVFRYGIRYCPKLKLPLQAEQKRADYECRTVVISGLSIRAQLRDVLGAVRGGKVLRATLVQLGGISDTATAIVQFANWRDAHAYNKYANSHGVVFCGHKCSVGLANTPSYPISPASMKSLEQGFTRCIEIKKAPMQELGAFVNSLRRWFPRVKDALEDAVFDLGEHNLVLRFRDLDSAAKTYRLAKNCEDLFPMLHTAIDFAADPCDGPFETLGKPQVMAEDELVRLTDLLGDPSWDIQNAYPDLDQAAGHIEHGDANPLPPVADRVSDHSSGHSLAQEGGHDESARQIPTAHNALDDIAQDPDRMYTDKEYLELRGFTAFLKDQKEWSTNISYWMSRTQKDLKPQI